MMSAQEEEETGIKAILASEYGPPDTNAFWSLMETSGNFTRNSMKPTLRAMEVCT
jgi:hypothetical protein